MFPGFSDNSNNGEEDYLDEFRQKLNDQSLNNFEERKNEINRSKNVFIGAVSGIALAAVVGWFVLAPRYSNETPAEVPVIRRPQSAIKVQPAEPGGMEILNQDKSVYDIIEKKDNSAPVVENLLPPPEEPQLPVIATVEEPSAPAEVLAPALNSAVEQQAKEIIKIAEAPQPQAAINSEPEAPLVPISKAIKTAPEVKTAEPALPAKAPEIKQAAPQPAPAPAVKAATSGMWQVQLLSSPNKNAMETSWNNLVKRYAVLKGQPHEVETADLGAKGTFYRLKAGAFASRDGADNLCADLKALGGSCIVKKK